MPTHPPLHYCWHVLTLVSPLSPALLVLSSGLCSRLPSPRRQKLARGNCRATEMMTPAGVKNAVAAEPPSMEKMTARRPTLMPKRAPSRRVVASNTGTKPKRRCLPCLSQRLRTWQSLICRSTNKYRCLHSSACLSRRLETQQSLICPAAAKGAYLPVVWWAVFSEFCVASSCVVPVRGKTGECLLSAP